MTIDLLAPIETPTHRFPNAASGDRRLPLAWMKAKHWVSSSNVLLLIMMCVENLFAPAYSLFCDIEKTILAKFTAPRNSRLMGIFKFAFVCAVLLVAISIRLLMRTVREVLDHPLETAHRIRSWFDIGCLKRGCAELKDAAKNDFDALREKGFVYFCCCILLGVYQISVWIAYNLIYHPIEICTFAILSRLLPSWSRFELVRVTEAANERFTAVRHSWRLLKRPSYRLDSHERWKRNKTWRDDRGWKRPLENVEMEGICTSREDWEACKRYPVDNAKWSDLEDADSDTSDLPDFLYCPTPMIPEDHDSASS